MNIIDTEIKGQKYKLVKLPPKEGGRLATKVGQMLIGALSDEGGIQSIISSYRNRQPIEGEAKDALSLLESEPKLLSALAGGVSKIDADVLYDCAWDCVKGNLFAESKLHDETAFNAWFEQHPAHLLPVMVWALKENCAGFFEFGGLA